MESSVSEKTLLSDLLFFDPKLEVIGDVNVAISSLTIDSRYVQRGSIFFARKGLSVNGARFAVQAVRLGACAIASDEFIEHLPNNITQLIYPDVDLLIARLANAFYKAPSEKMCVIGITGTSGKTTLSFIIEQLLEDMGKKTGLIGTVGVKVSGRLEPSFLTTADAIYTHSALSEMHKQKCTHAVLEVSSHALEQKRTGCVDFQAAVFTNLSPEHLDYHKNMEAYAQAKAKLFVDNTYGIRKKSSMRKIANADDPYSQAICPTPTLTYGIEAGDVQAEAIELNQKGAVFDLIFPSRFDKMHASKKSAHGCVRKRVTTPLVGLFNIYNLLAGVATLLDLGFCFDDFSSAIHSLAPPPGRLERIESALGFEVVIDYAHKPDALEKVLQTVKSLYKGRILLVFGCGGERDTAKRPLMGSIAEKLSDHTWITNDNPRNEDPLKIAEEIIGGFENKEGYTLELDRKAAIAEAVQVAAQGDCILIAGRGHEAFQIIGDSKMPFNDADVARSILAQMLAKRF